MDISYLPEEVFIEIALYFDLEDLLSCSLVNSKWRSAINQNKIWFKQCARRSDLKMNRFELLTEPNLVQPEFRFPEFNCDTLPEICPWRRRFMQEAYITKNWRTGRHSPRAFAEFNNLEYVECEETVLTVPSTKHREFTVFDIEKDPEEIQTVPYSLSHVSSDFYKLCENKIVIVQCTLLQVYDKTPDNKFELTHRSLFDKRQEEANLIPSNPDISEWYRTNIGLYPSDISTTCDHNGKFFVGLVLEGNLNKAVFHIWDVTTGQKVTEQPVPDIKTKIMDIQCSIHKSSLNILFQMMASSVSYTKIYRYDLNTLQYTNLILTYDYPVPIILFGDDFILNCDSSGKSVLLWRSDNGELVKKISCNFALHPMTVQFVFSFILLGGNYRGLGYVKVFSTSTLDMVCDFAADCKVSNVLFVRSNLILVAGCMRLGLWDITTATKIYTFGYNNCIWINVKSTKMIVECDEELYLLHFW